MAEVDFSDIKAADAWFEKQTAEVRSIMSSRAALRVAANLGQYDGDGAERLALTAWRCTLTSAVRGLGRTADVKWLTGAAHSAHSAASSAVAADYSARSAADAAASSALSAAHSAASSALSAASSARSAAHSAALSAHSAASSALSAATWDSARLDLNLNTQALWAGAEIPSAIQEAHNVFLTKLGGNPDWDFFRSWYEQMWEGTFTDWDLATEVAKIGDDVWSAGLGAVAEAIRGIEANRGNHFERPDTVPELQQKKLLEHVTRLLASPEMTALAAEGAAETLERAIAQYLKEAPANCLPDEMQHLEAVPGLFRRISVTVKSSEKNDAKATRLAEDIQALNAKIARLEADLKKARAGTVQGIFTQSALKAAGGAFGAGVMVTVGLAIKHFFGEWPGDMTLENMRNWLSDLESATPKPDDPSLPPDFEA